MFSFKPFYIHIYIYEYIYIKENIKYEKKVHGRICEVRVKHMQNFSISLRFPAVPRQDALSKLLSIGVQS